MYETSDIRKGLRIEQDGTPFVVLEFQFVKPGKGSAFTRTKIRNMISGAVLDRTFKSGEKLTPAHTEDREMQYLYYNDGEFHFMDKLNFEQVSLESSVVGDSSNYLTENMIVSLSFFQGRSIGLTLPNFVVLRVKETAPGEKGNTVTGASKPALLETKYLVNVPLFVSVGDQLRIDTRTGEYVERVKS